MDALLDFSQKSGIYDFMHSTWGWPAVETLHFMGLSLLIGTVGLFDLRMLGLAKGIPMNSLHRLVPWGVGGYALNVMTGVMFVPSAPDQYLFNPAFQVKLALMGIAGINVLLFLSIPVRSRTPCRRRGRRSSSSEGGGCDFTLLLDRGHRLWETDHLLSPALPLVLLVLVLEPTNLGFHAA